MAFRFLQNFYAHMTGDVSHLGNRLAAAADNPFQLVSLRPFYDEKTGAVDFNRPFQFQTDIAVVAPHHKVDHAIFLKASVSCADDICVHAVQTAHVDARAWGMDRTLREALFEVARRPETAHCRYIALIDPLLERGKRKSADGEKTPNAIVLENTAVDSAKTEHVMIVKLYSVEKECDRLR